MSARRSSLFEHTADDALIAEGRTGGSLRSCVLIRAAACVRCRARRLPMSQSPDEEEDGGASPIYDYGEQGEAEPESTQPWAAATAAEAAASSSSLETTAHAPHAAASAAIAASASIAPSVPAAPVRNHGEKRKADSSAALPAMAPLDDLIVAPAQPHLPLQAAAAVFPLMPHDENAFRIQFPPEKHRRVGDAAPPVLLPPPLPPAPPPPLPPPPPQALEPVPLPVAVHSVHKRKPVESASRVALETADKRARVDTPAAAPAAAASAAAAAAASSAEPVSAASVTGNLHNPPPAARPPIRRIPLSDSHAEVELDDWLVAAGRRLAEVHRRRREFAPIDQPSPPPHRPTQRRVRPMDPAANDAAAAAAVSSAPAAAAVPSPPLPAHESWLATARARSKLQFSWTSAPSGPRLAPIRELEPTSRDLRVAPLIPLPPLQPSHAAQFNPRAPVDVFGRRFARPLQQASEWCEHGFAQLARLLADADQTQLTFLIHTQRWAHEDAPVASGEPQFSLLQPERRQAFHRLREQTWLALRQADAFLLLLNSFVVATCTEGHGSSSFSSAFYSQQSSSSQSAASGSFPEFTPSARLGFILALNDGALHLFASLLAAPPAQGLGPSRDVLEFCSPSTLGDGPTKTGMQARLMLAHNTDVSVADYNDDIDEISSAPPEEPPAPSRPLPSPTPVAAFVSSVVSSAAVSLSSHYTLLRLKVLNEVLWLFDQHLLKYHIGAIRECKKKEQQQANAVAAAAASRANAAAISAATARPSDAASAAASSSSPRPIPAAAPPPQLPNYFPFFSFVDHAFQSLLGLADRHPGVLRLSGSSSSEQGGDDAGEPAEHKDEMRDDPTARTTGAAAGAGASSLKWLFDPLWSTWLKLQESLRLVEYNVIFTPQSIDDRLASFGHLFVSLQTAVPAVRASIEQRLLQLRSYLESLRELKTAGCSPTLPSPEPPSLFWMWLRWTAEPLFDSSPLLLPAKLSLHRPLHLHKAIVVLDRRPGSEELDLPIEDDTHSVIRPFVQDDEVALMCSSLDTMCLAFEKARMESPDESLDELGHALANLSVHHTTRRSTCEVVLGSSSESSVLQRMESVLETAWMLLASRTHFEIFDSGVWMTFKHWQLDSSSLQMHHSAIPRGVGAHAAAAAAEVVFTATSPFHLLACTTEATEHDLYDRSMSANAFVASLALNTDWELFRLMFARMRALPKHCFGQDEGLFDRATTFSRFWLRMHWIQKLSLLSSRNHAAESRFLVECLLSCDYFSPALPATAALGKIDPKSWALPDPPTALMWEHHEAVVTKIVGACYTALSSAEAEKIDAVEKKPINVSEAVFILAQQMLHGFLWRSARPLAHWSRLFALKHADYTAPPTALTAEIVSSLERRALALADSGCRSFVESVVGVMSEASSRAFHLEPLSIHIGAVAQPYFSWENGQRISPQAARNLIALQRRCSVVVLLSSLLPLKQQAPLVDFLQASSVFVAPGAGELVLIPSETGQRSECDLPLIEETATEKKQKQAEPQVLELDATGNPVPTNAAEARKRAQFALSSRHFAFTLYMQTLAQLVALRQSFMDLHSSDVCRVFLNRAKLGSAPNLTPLQKESAGDLHPKHPFSLLKPPREEDPPVGDVWRWNFNERDARAEGSYRDVITLMVEMMQPCWTSYWHAEQKRTTAIDLNHPRTTDAQKREEARDRLLRRGRVRFLLSMMRQWSSILQQHQTDANWGLHDLDLLQTKVTITAENEESGGDGRRPGAGAAAAAGAARPAAASALSGTPTLFLAQLLHVHHAHIRLPPDLRRASLQVLACFLPCDPPFTGGKHASETADEEKKANEEEEAKSDPAAASGAAASSSVALPAPPTLTADLSDDAMMSALSAVERRAPPVSYAAMQRESRMGVDIDRKRRELRAEYSAALATILLAHFLAPIQQLMFCNLHDPNTWRLFSEAAAPQRRSDQIAAARPGTLAAMMAQQQQAEGPICPLADHLFKGEHSNLPLVALDLLVKVAFLLTSIRRTTWTTVVDIWLPRENHATVIAGSIPSIRSVTGKVHKFADVVSPLRESLLLRFYTQLLSPWQRNHEGTLITVPPLMAESPQTYVAFWIQSMIDVHLETTKDLNLYTTAILNYCELVNAAVPARPNLLTELFAPLMRVGRTNSCELRLPSGWQSGDSLKVVFRDRNNLLSKVLRAYAAKFSLHPIAIPGIKPAPPGQSAATAGAINIFHSLHHLLRANVAKVLEGTQSDRARWTNIFSNRYVDFVYSFVGSLCSTAADCLVPLNSTASLAVAQSLFNTAMVSQPFGTKSQEIWRASFLVLGSVLRSVALLFPVSASSEAIDLSVMYRPSGAIGAVNARSLLTHLWRHYLLRPYEPGVREHEKENHFKLILPALIPQWIKGLSPIRELDTSPARLTQHTLLRRYIWAVFVGQALFQSVALQEGEVRIEVAFTLLGQVVWPVLQLLDRMESAHKRTDVEAR